MKRYFKAAVFCFLFFFIFWAGAKYAYAANININFGASEGETDPAAVASSLQIVFILIIISLSPSLLIMLTCFTRIVISLHFVRSALGTQQMPPNQVMVGLALILTFFLMEPQFTQIYNGALMPYSRGELSAGDAVTAAMEPIRDFMLHQAEDKDLSLFSGLAGLTYETAEQFAEEVPNRVLIPAFVLGEITKGFVFGFYIYLPFIAIDMIVASTLMAMGMMMLPPAMISLPFKILLFIMADGWGNSIRSIISTFVVPGGG